MKRLCDTTMRQESEMVGDGQRQGDLDKAISLSCVISNGSRQVIFLIDECNHNSANTLMGILITFAHLWFYNW